jgi:hypothetical protein
MVKYFGTPIGLYQTSDNYQKIKKHKTKTLLTNIYNP